MRSILTAFVRAIRRFGDPVCQDWNAPRFGTYKNHLVQLVPVADTDDPHRIADWIPDPEQVAAIDTRIPEFASASAPAATPAAPAPTGFVPSAGSGL